MPFNLDQFLTGIDHLILFLDKRIKELSPGKTKLDEFRRNCCKYLLTQLNRLRKVYKTAPMEEVAFICRNIFELVLTVKYYGTTEEDAHVFLLQADVDKILIHEGILEWQRAKAPKSPEVQNLNHVTTSKQQGVKPPPRATVRQMAEKVNMTVEYDGFYKFYSKYIHPSAWIINKPIEELESPGYREILIRQSIIYATEVAKLLGAIMA